MVTDEKTYGSVTSTADGKLALLQNRGNGQRLDRGGNLLGGARLENAVRGELLLLDIEVGINAALEGSLAREEQAVLHRAQSQNCALWRRSELITIIS